MRTSEVNDNIANLMNIRLILEIKITRGETNIEQKTVLGTEGILRTNSLSDQTDIENINKSLDQMEF